LLLDSIKKSQGIQKDRPLDVSFLIDAVTKMNEGADSRFTGRVDTDAVGVVGMSFGGWTAAKAAETDARIKGAVCHCPSLVRGVDAPHTPIMMLTGAEDTVVGAEVSHLPLTFFLHPSSPPFLPSPSFTFLPSFIFLHMPYFHHLPSFLPSPSFLHIPCFLRLLPLSSFTPLPPPSFLHLLSFLPFFLNLPGKLDVHGLFQQVYRSWCIFGGHSSCWAR
jgi:hypothetical protein